MNRPRSGDGWVVFAWVVAGLGIAAVVVVLPLVLFWLVAGDPYGRTYVEHRADGFYLGRRVCDPTPIRRVEVSVYDEQSDVRPPAIWSATAIGSGAAEVRIFGPTVGFAEVPARSVFSARTYTVVSDPETDDEQWVTSDLSRIPVGSLDFGDGRPVTPQRYAAMPDGDFGC